MLCGASGDPIYTWIGCIADMELGHWVTGSVGHLGHLSRPGHRVIIMTLCENRVFFPVFEKMPKMQNVHLKCWNNKSYCQVSVVGLKSMDVSPCSELLLLPMIIKNSLAWEYFFVTFRVHYRTGSLDQLGLRVAGFLGHWVAGSRNVTQFRLCGIVYAVCPSVCACSRILVCWWWRWKCTTWKWRTNF